MSIKQTASLSVDVQQPELVATLTQSPVTDEMFNSKLSGSNKISNLYNESTVLRSAGHYDRNKQFHTNRASPLIYQCNTFVGSWM